MNIRNSKENSIQKRNSQIKVAVALLCLIIITACFVAGTAVLMASGASKAIEDIQIGDMVKSYNSVTGKVENRRVLQTFESDTDELVKITTSDGQNIMSTPDHNFYANNNWVSANDLRAGDVLVNVNGEKVVVELVQHEILDNLVKVYNFHVDGNQNYYVSQYLQSENTKFVLVHNSCQKHHVITRKIKREMNNNPNLKNVSRNKSSIFEALTEDAHKGYQKWHREYDDYMVKWLQNNREATLQAFEEELQKYYNKPEMIERFGEVIVKLFLK